MEKTLFRYWNDDISALGMTYYLEKIKCFHAVDSKIFSPLSSNPFFLRVVMIDSIAFI